MFSSKKYYFSQSLSFLVRLLLLILLIIPIITLAQKKSKKTIELVKADNWLNDESVAKGVSRIIGDVVLKHNTTIMECDSAWKYSNTNIVDFFGNVHIISNDTLHMWADFINYNGNTELARARFNVTLEDPSLTLTTDSLDFDMNEEIGYYNYGGTIVDSTNTLTSTVGRYYTKLNELFFTEDVKLVNEEYTMTTDTMTYNTETEIANFEGITNLIGDSTYLYSTKGWFDTKSNVAELNKNSTIRRGDTQIQADYIYINDETGIGNAQGNVIINDYGNNMIVVGEKAVYNDFNKYALVTDSAMWVQYYEGDSLFLHADTLYTMPDTTSEGDKLLVTYYNSRFYRTDIQGIADSLIYFTRDSTIQLYKDPVLWSVQNQMTAEFIEFKNKSKAPNEIYLNEDSFIIQEIDSTKFNQIKGKNMIGFINGAFLYRIDVNGNGQSIYYPADDDDYIGINKAESSSIILYLIENQVKRIVFNGAPTGTMNPLSEVSAETSLPGFNWRKEERPKSRYDIFDNYSDSIQVIQLPKIEINNVLPDIEQAKSDLEKEQ